MLTDHARTDVSKLRSTTEFQTMTSQCWADKRPSGGNRAPAKKGFLKTQEGETLHCPGGCLKVLRGGSLARCSWEQESEVTRHALRQKLASSVCSVGITERSIYSISEL